MLKYSIFLIIIFHSINMFSQTSDGNKKRFKDFYNLTDVNKAEASLFKVNNYTLVDDYTRIIELIQYSKIVVAKFIPKTEVMFFKSLDNTTYNICFSETFRYFKIDGKTFSISKKKSKEISEILNK